MPAKTARPKKANRSQPSMPAPTSSRAIVQYVLQRVWGEQAYAERVLDTLFERTPLDDRDRRLITELVYGTLRRQRFLDLQLQTLLRKPLNKLPLHVLAALRLGAYQLLYTRVPPHAAVSESVNLLSRRAPHLRGVVNAVLRELARRIESNNLAKASEGTAIEQLALTESLPSWVVNNVWQQFGESVASSWAQRQNAVPSLTLRIHGIRSTLSAVQTKLQKAGLDAQINPELPTCLTVGHGGKVIDLPGFSEGLFSVQDAAAQLVGLVANPAPGSNTVDLCAAPGGKSTHLAELLVDQGRILAIDVAPQKISLIEESCRRLGLRSVTAQAVDATNAHTLKKAVQQTLKTVDTVILDAPCSGTGTLRRHPEIRNRPQESLQALCDLQKRLLDNASTLLQAGGVLIYSVCSVLSQEGTEQIAGFLQRHTDFAPDPFSQNLEKFSNTFNGLFPRLTAISTVPFAMDGFFIARLKRTK